MNIAELDTPALLIDLDIMDRNLGNMADSQPMERHFLMHGL